MKTYLFIALVLLASAMPGMAQKISTLNAGGAISGSDLFYDVQSGASVKVTGSQFETFVLTFAQPVNSNLTAFASGNPFTAGSGINFTGTYPSITISSNASAPAWGTITGTLTNQTDLASELSGKQTALTFSTGLTLTGSSLAVTANTYDAYGAASTAQSNAETFSANGSNITSGTVAAARVATLNQNTSGSAGSVPFSGITGITGSASSSTYLNGSGAWSTPSAGTVTSMSSGNLSPLFTTSVATSTSTPALSFSLSSAAQNSVFAGPASGGSGAPSFQTAPTISAANMTNFPTLNQNTTGSAGSVALANITGMNATVQTDAANTPNASSGLLTYAAIGAQVDAYNASTTHLGNTTTGSGTTLVYQESPTMEDTNGNDELIFGTASSAVDYLKLFNAATNSGSPTGYGSFSTTPTASNGVTLTPSGSDSLISIGLVAKGQGSSYNNGGVAYLGTTVGTSAISISNIGAYQFANLCGIGVCAGDGMTVPSGQAIGFLPNGNIYLWSQVDTGFIRAGVGVLDLGTGAAGNTSGTLQLSTLVQGYKTSTTSFTCIPGFNTATGTTSSLTATLPTPAVAGEQLWFKNNSSQSWTVASASGSQIIATGATTSASSSITVTSGSYAHFMSDGTYWNQM